MKLTDDKITNDAAKARFDSFIDVQPITGCWLWTGSIERETGQPRFTLYGEPVNASRAAQLLYGPGEIKPGLVCGHRCESGRLCVRPGYNHCYQEARAVTAQRARSNRRIGKLIGEDVDAIRERAQAGEKRDVLADEYGITYKHLGKILRGEAWAQIEQLPGA